MKLDDHKKQEFLNDLVHNPQNNCANVVFYPITSLYKNLH